MKQAINVDAAFTDKYLERRERAETLIVTYYRETTHMIRVLGRATSGNVQKVLFVLEEIGLKYTREDYGRQFNNTADAGIQEAQSEQQGADPDRRRHRDLGDRTPSCAISRRCISRR